jgi:hypothetical protein
MPSATHQEEARKLVAGRVTATRPWRCSARRLGSLACFDPVLARRLPAMIVAGAMRCGTTSLFALLEGHPRLAPSLFKELHFFDLHHARGAAWYRRQFRPSIGLSGGRMRLPFESSPYYMFEPRVPGRVRALLPDVKLVFLLRDPVERAFSHYRKNVRDGREPLSFADALDAEEERLAGEEERLLDDASYVSPLHQYYSYRARGCYAEQLGRWCDIFPHDQMLVLDAGRLFAGPREVLGEVLAFLGVDPWQPPRLDARNVGTGGGALDPAVHESLRTFYAPHERRLRDLLGWSPAVTPISAAA